MQKEHFTKNIHPFWNRLICIYQMLTYKEFILILIEGKGEETTIKTSRRTDRSDEYDADLTEVSSQFQREMIQHKIKNNLY